ncbi:MAG: 3-methyladenine DNA glycosylase [Balneolaceae bacterium]|nr:3-methyladenine DNA glycosylase [Balneolaceae bacterium]
MLKVFEQISPDASVLQEEDWVAQMNDHEESLSEVLDPYLEKRSRQEKDPVLDFLFEYYAFRPSHLMRWSPGIGTTLQYSDKSNLPEISELSCSNGLARLDPTFFPQKRVRSAKWTLELLEKSAERKPMFGCFGMHEWAMVYRAENVRHQQIPLRLSDDEIAEFVESRPLVCTHFDAFRFFTDKAQPMNKNQLSRETFQDTEQPGCVHTNMDLYKWAFKLHPWVSSELIREAFFNALETRKVDMQASPYDATEFGLDPIKIETETGRKKYVERQMEIYQNSQPIRYRLINAYQEVIQTVS